MCYPSTASAGSMSTLICGRCCVLRLIRWLKHHFGRTFGAESVPDHREQTQGAVCPSKISAKTEEIGFGRVWTGHHAQLSRFPNDSGNPPLKIIQQTKHLRGNATRRRFTTVGRPIDRQLRAFVSFLPTLLRSPPKIGNTNGRSRRREKSAADAVRQSALLFRRNPTHLNPPTSG